jgi:hypothetical protein
MKIMMKNHGIENDMIDRDHHPSNVIDINVHDQDQDLVIIDKNDIDVVDHVHHYHHRDEDDQDQDQNDVHLEDVQVQYIIELHIPNHE